MEDDLIQRVETEGEIGEAFRMFVNTAYKCAKAAFQTPPQNRSEGAFFNDVEDFKKALAKAADVYTKATHSGQNVAASSHAIMNSAILRVVSHLLEVASLSPATLGGSRDIILRTSLQAFASNLRQP